MVSRSRNGQIDENQKWSHSIRAVFPSRSSLENFEKDNPGLLPLFLDPLKRQGLLATGTKEALVEFLQTFPLIPNEDGYVQDYSFEDVLQHIINVSNNELAKHLNHLVEQLELNALFNHKKIGASMFSRLKSAPADTTIKRNYLRILAFYLGWNQGNHGLNFHYEALLHICATQPDNKHSFGIRIGFSISIIDINAFNHLKKLLKACMEESTLLKPLKINALTLESRFALYIDIPNTLSSDRIFDTTPYGPGIRDAVALSHQMLIKWQLSPKNDHMQPNLSIGIMAGNFSDLTNLHQLLGSKHSNDFPQIKITDFVKKCLIENNVRATFGAEPEVLQIPSEFPITLWIVEGWWSWIYIQFINEMIDIPDGESAESIYLPSQYQPVKVNKVLKTAIQHFYHNTQNALLGLEIAKTFYYQKDFFNALEVLQTILREAPNHINALTLKISILFSQASSLDDPMLSELQFNRANDVAERMLHSHDCYEEDAFNEIGIGRLSRAIQYLRCYRKRVLRNGASGEKTDDMEIIIDLIRSAEKAFIRGTNSTSTGHRSMYYLLLIRILLNIFRSHAYRFTSEGIHITDPGLFKATAHRFFKDFGWLPESSPDNDFRGVEKPMMDAMNSFGKSVRLQCVKANTFVGFALILHDVGPNIYSESDSREIIVSWITEALSWAQKNHQDNLYTYTDSRRLCGELLTCDEFKRHVDVWLDIVKNKKDTKLMFANMFDG